MTLDQRKRELNALLESELGMDEIAKIYATTCKETGPKELGMTPELMISQIIYAEFPLAHTTLIHC